MGKGAPNAKAFRCCQRGEGWWSVQDLVFCVVSSPRLSILASRLSPDRWREKQVLS
ncbi:unnamed protein product [Musa hybrid cultivar]